MMKHIWLLAKRDFLQRGRSKGFLVMMGLTMTAIIAIGPIMTAIAPDDDAIHIGLTGETPPGLETALSAAATAAGMTIDVDIATDVAAGESMLENGDISVLVVGDSEMVWAGEPGPVTSSIVRSALASVERELAFEELGLTPEEAASLLTPSTPSERRLEPEDPERGPRIVAGYAVVIILYIAILVFGQFVMLGVMEEKASRVVEVVLSRTRPEAVLAGKVIGIGMLGLIQVVAMAGAGLLTVRLIEAEVDVPPIGLAVAISSVVWFILGYGFYATIYAGLGATITRQEDVQGAATLPVILILPSYFIALISLESPDSMLARITSILPPTSPIVMPMRSAVADVPLVELGLSMALLVLAAVGLIKVSARIYRGAALRIGAKVPLREAWRAAEQ